jgi:hypothetical protein
MPLQDLFWMCYDNPQHCRMLAQLALDLIAGLAYLYVKSGNLVCTNDFRLQIIDYYIAVRVASEVHMVEGVYGTEGWMTPEMRGGAVFSPIRADRWCCGKTLLRFLAKGGDLMNKNPAHRPSLIDWSAERLDTTPCDDGDMWMEGVETRNRKLRPRMTLELFMVSS